MKLLKSWLEDFVDLSDLSAEALENVITTKIAEVDGFLGQGKESVFEIDNKSLTHRPDLWSHFGFARELAGVLRRPLKVNWDRYADDGDEGAKFLSGLQGKGQTKFRVEIERNCGCRRFAALEIANVKASESPTWIKERLAAVGIGSKNLVVDLSNYVMLDLGQPNHTYDADRLSGNTIFVRRAKEKEKFHALDDTQHELFSSDIVIADSGGVVALGGVIGGDSTAIDNSTKRLLLESANFDPTLVRVSAKRHGLRTDASNRFEKGRSVFSVPLAIQRMVQLLKELSPGCEVVGSVVDSFVERPNGVSVPLDNVYIRSRLTEKLGDNQIGEILSGLGFKSDGQGNVRVPHERATRDISIAEDLVEEIGRVYGYENIPELPPTIKATATARNELKESEYVIRDFLVGAGFSEVSNYSFSNPERLSQLGFSNGVFEKNNCVELENPIDVELSVLRPSLIPGMLQFADDNARYFDEFAIFELGRSYHRKEFGLKEAREGKWAGFERRLLSLAYLSGRSETLSGSASYPEIAAGGDFYAVASLVRRLARLFGCSDVNFRPLNGGAVAEGAFTKLQDWMHPFRAAKIEIDGAGEAVGLLAEVKPGLLKNTEGRVLVLELDLEKFIGASKAADKFTAISKFPVSLFEMSVVMPKNENYLSLRQLLDASAPKGLLQRIDVLAVYEGKPLNAGEKSVSVKLHLGSIERTLTSEELKAIQDGLIAAVQKSKYSLRA